MNQDITKYAALIPTFGIIAYSLYIIFNPQKFNLSPKKTLIGKILCVIVITLFFGKIYLLYNDSNSNDTEDISSIEQTLHDNLKYYSIEHQNNIFTEACIKVQLIELEKYELASSTRDLIAKVVCSCMSSEFSSTDEYLKTKNNLKNGQDFNTAMNAFMDAPDFKNKIQKCENYE